MKKIFSLLALVSLSLTAASAAQAFETTGEVVVFATHDVRVSRHTPAEKTIEQSLAEFRAQAGRIAPVRVELPALHPLAQKQDQNDANRQVAAQQEKHDGARS